MAFDPAIILAAVGSHAATLGVFEQVIGHEPSNAPHNGVVAAVWIDRMAPAAGASGLNNTTGILTVAVRVYTSLAQLERDAIDPAVLGAVHALMTSYSGDFTLGGLIRNVDLLGAHGQSLDARAGYLDLGGKMFRIMVVTVPMVINDMWPQA